MQLSYDMSFVALFSYEGLFAFFSDLSREEPEGREFLTMCNRAKEFLPSEEVETREK